jgi:hypothetical protein
VPRMGFVVVGSLGFWGVSRFGRMREGVLWAVSLCACGAMVRVWWLGFERVLNYCRTSAACAGRVSCAQTAAAVGNKQHLKLVWCPHVWQVPAQRPQAVVRVQNWSQPLCVPVLVAAELLLL